MWRWADRLAIQRLMKDIRLKKYDKWIILTEEQMALLQKIQDTDDGSTGIAGGWGRF
ncbi:hypothetical protein GMA11_03010 [Granulicatella sp. zg-ZJ]|uniref:hypothetical protein n=1 Tax=Granulicatella sp. zg-ZJ TaxID=2678504 RepID=UPI0013D773F3|nr:hypothetical protein [Granulicatella sp. zg-ZJ]MBS4750153.1 hypothetical protein [Carnobacteriaceae bacterium zg-ZUI78]NEW62356.1 hypothetical protein [Granulicatella sp. zg-ZJ]